MPKSTFKDDHDVLLTFLEHSVSEQAWEDFFKNDFFEHAKSPQWNAYSLARSLRSISMVEGWPEEKAVWGRWAIEDSECLFMKTLAKELLKMRGAFCDHMPQSKNDLLEALLTCILEWGKYQFDSEAPMAIMAIEYVIGDMTPEMCHLNETIRRLLRSLEEWGIMYKMFGQPRGVHHLHAPRGVVGD